MANKIEKPPKDHRYFPRWKAAHRLVFKKGFDGNACEAKSLDLSCSGMSFKTDEDVHLGDRIKMTLHFSLEEFVDLTCQIIWVNQNQHSQHVGVQFYNTTDETQETILEHAFEIKKDDVVNNWFKGWQ